MQELKCRDKRQDVVKKKYMTFKFMWMSARSSRTWICKHVPPWVSEWKKEKRKFKTKSLSALRGYINVRVCDWERANTNTRTSERLHKLLGFHFNSVLATPLFTHIGLVVSHEHGEVGEVAAGAGGVCAVGVQQPAALRRPVAGHRTLRIVPKGAIWGVIIFQLRNRKNKARADEERWYEFMRPDVIRSELGHLQVFECEDHWLS